MEGQNTFSAKQKHWFHEGMSLCLIEGAVWIGLKWKEVLIANPGRKPRWCKWGRWHRNVGPLRKQTARGDHWSRKRASKLWGINEAENLIRGNSYPYNSIPRKHNRISGRITGYITYRNNLWKKPFEKEHFFFLLNRPGLVWLLAATQNALINKVFNIGSCTYCVWNCNI